MITEAILRWRMRRGVLELDHILNTFLDKNYNKLSEEAKVSILELLECQDPMLLEWLLYRSSLPVSKSLRAIVVMILQDADRSVL